MAEAVSDPEEIVPNHLVSDADFWRAMARELRALAALAPRPHAFEMELEAGEAQWRADLLERVWTDVGAFLVLVEARCEGIGLDAALMCAFPNA